LVILHEFSFFSSVFISVHLWLNPQAHNMNFFVTQSYAEESQRAAEENHKNSAILSETLCLITVARATRWGDEAGASLPDVNSAVLSAFSAALCVTKKCKKQGGWANLTN